MAPKTVSHKNRPSLKSHFVTIKTEPNDNQDVILTFPKLTSRPPYSPHQPPLLYTGECYLTHKKEQQHAQPLNRNEPPDFFPLLTNDVYAKIRQSRIRYRRHFPTKNNSIKQVMDSMNPFWQLNKPCKHLYENILSRRRKSKQNDDDDDGCYLPWTEKYRPTKTKGLFFGGKIFDWLESSKINNQGKGGGEGTSSSSKLYLLVGPCGSGKSAAVQTAAQEAGYEIFESNPITKRSGKDLLHQLGEMTSSHLVGFDNVNRVNKRRKRTEETTNIIILKDNVIPKTKKKKKRKVLAGHNDMMHYFQKVNLKEDTIEDNDGDIEMEVEEVDISVEEDRNSIIDNSDVNKVEEEDEEESEDIDDDLPLLQPPKQSLVLLEEVDLLFEEDKGFWFAVKELCEKSKRPIIMTCNDVSKIPLDMLDIEQTIYFKVPDRQNLTSYLELIGLAEGFIIPTNDLSQLVQSYNCDTRRLIHTLQFWCRRRRRKREQCSETVQTTSLDNDEFYVYEGFYKEVTSSNQGEDEVVVAEIEKVKENVCLKGEEEEKKSGDDLLELMYTKIQAASHIDTWVAQEDRLQQHLNAIDQYYSNDIILLDKNCLSLKRRTEEKTLQSQLTLK